MKDYYVYAFLREDNTPYYIGKGRKYRAWTWHGRTIPSPQDRSKITILYENLYENDALQMEMFLIFIYGRVSRNTGILRNLTDGGDNNPGRKLSDEQKNKIRIGVLSHPSFAKGIKKSDEAKKNMSIAQKQRQSEGRGTKQTPESIFKIKLSNTGKKRTQETKDKISASKIGLPSPRKGCVVSEESKKKMSIARKLMLERKKQSVLTL